MVALLDCCQDHGVTKLVFSSSAATYGLPDVDLVDEDTPCLPLSPYGETKLIGEWLIRTAPQRGGWAPSACGTSTWRARRPRSWATPALVEGVRRPTAKAKRWGAQQAFPVASLRGVEVRASRLLTSDEAMPSLSIPCRTRAVQEKDFTGRDANGVGVARRIENMVDEIPAYRRELQHRQDFAGTRTEELLASRTSRSSTRPNWARGNTNWRRSPRSCTLMRTARKHTPGPRRHGNAWRGRGVHRGGVWR